MDILQFVKVSWTSMTFVDQCFKMNTATEVGMKFTYEILGGNV